MVDYPIFQLGRTLVYLTGMNDLGYPEGLNRKGAISITRKYFID